MVSTSIICNILLNIILSRYFGVFGIAFASVVAMVITSLLLFRSIIKIEHNFKIRDIVTKIIVIVFNSMIMGTVILFVVKIIENKVNAIVLVSSGTAVGMIVYFVLGYMFKIEEVIELKNMFLSKFKR